MRQVRTREMNTSEPPLTCRNRLERHQNGDVMLAPDQPGGYLLTAQVVPGIEAASSESWLSRGTAGTRTAMAREKRKRRSREADSIDVLCGDGAARSSVEASVMEVERRGCVIQLATTVNCGSRRSR